FVSAHSTHPYLHPFPTRRSSDLGLKPLERGFGYLPDVLWPAVQPSQTSLRLGIDFPSELRGDHHLAPKRSKGFAYKLFVCVRTIDRKSTRLNSSHGSISYAVFCL